MDIDKIIATLYVLPEPSKAALIATAKQVTYPKGYILLKADRIEKNIYFIKKGVVRAYSDAPGGQVTFWFGVEGAPVLSMKSYITGEKSYENIELLEDCEFFELNIASLKALYEKDIHLANWGRKLAEHELVKTEERLIAMQFKTAQERYMDLIGSQPALLLRVQLGYIASYLGMSQVSLSRIRAGLK
ncbi:Crp/Fnr family transcriptional regulator [Mucilaginibacter sp. Bleaf8]|uniref:Crp/Fnr family transcriptional regulator n=1 Tax=Mucilaginibacter sp. Bleaf8 TaxID=2834430 RepID=UPI001BD0F235|nr:Crp/Fnr family transcriptional regulator [Mucilaginibacter sp. Bleaf8]MBS7566710.1 Crp/Fnr family transcriptional regulator [Mucilaginibacter sp. Bleaf8]